MYGKIKLTTIVFAFTLINLQNTDAQSLKEIWSKTKSEVQKISKKKKREIEKKSDGIGGTSTKNESESKMASVEMDFGEMIHFKAPSNDFKSFVLPGFKGLLRFGRGHNYDILANKRIYGDLTNEERKALDKQMWNNINNTTRYQVLVETNYLKEWYDDMDKENFTTHEEVNRARPNNQSGDKTEYTRLRNSQMAQFYLLTTAGALSSKNILNDFFCNPNKEDCTKQEENPKNASLGIGVGWGGSYSSEFEKRRKFSEYSKTQLPTLRKWSNSFWENDELYAYFVTNIQQYKTKEYDFKNKGYWLGLNLGIDMNKGSGSINSGSEILPFDIKYVPKYRYEKERESSDVLLKMDEKKAENLSTNNGGLNGYAVYKIRIVPNGFSADYNRGLSSSHPLEFNFNLASPIVELYKDAQLTVKISEVSLEDVIYKN